MAKKDKPKLKDRLRAELQLMLSMDVPPRKMALSCGLGVFIGVSPYIGLQTYLAVVCARFFRIPLPPMLIGGWITNPLTSPFIYFSTTKFGMWLLNYRIQFDIDFADLTFKYLLSAGKALIIPFFVGTQVVCAVLGVITYFITYYILKRYKKSKVAKAPQASDNAEQPEKEQE